MAKVAKQAALRALMAAAEGEDAALAELDQCMADWIALGGDERAKRDEEVERLAKPMSPAEAAKLPQIANGTKNRASALQKWVQAARKHQDWAYGGGNPPGQWYIDEQERMRLLLGSHSRGKRRNDP